MGRSKSRTRGNNSTSKRSLRSASDPLRPVSPDALRLARAEERRRFWEDVWRDPSQDMRTWHPEGDDRPIRTPSGRRAKFGIRPEPRPRARPQGREFRPFVPRAAHIGFFKPDDLLICVRRQIRKEVMHARRKTGRRGQRKPTWSWRSKVRCK